jgi:hypothetical protein
MKELAKNRAVHGMFLNSKVLISGKCTGLKLIF